MKTETAVCRNIRDEAELCGIFIFIHMRENYENLMELRNKGLTRA